MITVEDVVQAARRLNGVIRPTRVEQSTALSRVIGRPIYVKPEHLQRTGSFKIRGAYNRISVLAETGSAGAVVAASAGNHAQGVALAASLTHLESTIFMPIDASIPKVEATRSYGATVMQGGTSIDDCILAAKSFAEKTGAVYIPPFDDPLVIAGQGTIGLEIADEAPDCRLVVVPIGGGGLISGVATALKARVPAIRIVGVEPVGAASMTAALEHGAPTSIGHCDTIADGVATRAVSQLTLDHVSTYVDEVVSIEDEQISKAVLLLIERCKWVVEPAGAVGLAALLAGIIDGSEPAAVVLSGGNVDPLLLTHLIAHGLTAAGRYLRVKVVLRDQPGALANLTAVLGDLRLNILEVEHTRSGASLRLGEVEVLLTLETRDPGHRNEVLEELQHHGMRAELLE
jgi:threonine dehydratase